MIKRGLIFLFLTVCSICYATHNRAGEILYKRVAPFTKVVGGVSVPTYSYLITVIVYSDYGNNVADRCADTVYFGDGQRGIALRSNGGFGNGCNCPNQAQCGEQIISIGNYNVKKNIYIITHVYAGAGSYLIRMIDPNRNANIYNMTNSVDQAFYVESLLIINSLTGANSSPIFNFDPIDRACKDKCFYHNPGAYDVDGDLLTYSITMSRKSDGSPCNGYTYPNSGANGIYNINSTTGLLTWCNPQFIAEYNLAFIVYEWRKNTSGSYQLIGYVLRDMQVVVDACPNNNPPTILLPQDTCVEAGTLIKKKFTVIDVTPNGVISTVTLEGNSGSFSCLTPNSSLSNTIGIATYTSLYTWQTTCDHIKSQPHSTVFKVTDNGAPNPVNGMPGIKLASFNTYNVKVVPKAVQNVTAFPVGSSMKISWSISSCSPLNNQLISYNIYRKEDCAPVNTISCQTGVSPTSGFIFLGQTNSSTSNFIDNNGGSGLVVGKNYSYIVVAKYSDGIETFGSAQVCSKLKRDMPLLLNVDVVTTSVSFGIINLRWLKPLLGFNDLDTIKYPGPYKFNVTYRTEPTGTYSSVATFTSQFFLNLPVSFTHSNLNTASDKFEYKIEFIAAAISIGASQKASSVFLSLAPADRKIKLSWISNTPWDNYKYTIQRKNPSSLNFTTIATTTLTSYTDSVNIVNRYSYCYKIISEGKYSDTSIINPLINNSQQFCATAIDITPPCSPTINIDADCPKGFVKINWANLITACYGSDDVQKYVVFFKPSLQANYEIVDTIIGAEKTSFIFDDLSFVSGCYAVQAIDSSGNASKLSVDFCIDNCPEFELPNIVTSNGDGVNDFFKAIKIRQIKEIDLKVYDRWGNLVYKTNDPYFKWNTISIFSNQPVSEGTFFYVCHVFEPRLRGLITRTIKGYLEVVR